LARLFGSAAVGLVRDHVLAVFWGCGANGKSVLLEVLMYVFGAYAKPGPSSLIVANGSHEPHPTDVASCVGSRLVVVHETKRGAAFDASKVKLLTGGDMLTARHMRQDFFAFRPSHTLVMLSNYRPEADATDAALWRRVQLVPFDVVIPEAQRDVELAEKLKSEASGILRWIVDGALEWQRIGLSPPAAVREQTEAYRTSEDVIGAFLEECTDRIAGHRQPAGALYSAFKRWCDAQGARPARGNDFAAELSGRGFRSARTSSGTFYAGIMLRSAGDDQDWGDR
jgi:putative DNA primase/helicase